MHRATRRSFLKRGSAAALGWSALPGSASSNERRLRVGIIGGGLSGVSCAWLLDGVADAVLFDDRDSVGGHAHTIAVPLAGRPVFVDVGAQFFARGPHPTYSKLLELIGLTLDNEPAADATFEAEMSITVSDESQELPRFVSPTSERAWPILAPWNRNSLIAFLLFSLAAKKLTEDGDWLVSLDAWLEALPVGTEEKERLILPLVSAMVGCSIEQARSLSARSALVFVGRALPDNLLDPFRYSGSLVGLGGNVRYLSGITGNTTVHVGSPVVRVEPLPSGELLIRNRDGVVEKVDVVVLATPPYVSKRLLPRDPALRAARRALRRFDFFDAEISIHTDPIYMPEKLLHWSAYNPCLEGDRCEASVWYGALWPRKPGSPPAPIFKSWATARSSAPSQELFRRAFRHPLTTPDFIDAGRRLRSLQGRSRIWFAGSYTREVDSQESALLSAMAVVRDLAPEAPHLLELESV